MNTNIIKKQKGFTLLELLIVIAILAVLAAATVIVINPAELLARARDSQRMSDVNAIKSAVSFFMVEAPAGLTIGGINPTCTPAHVHAAIQPVGTAAMTLATTTSQLTNGTGWIPVNLATLAGGSPLPMFPVDPINTNVVGATGARFYSYFCRLGAPGMGFSVVANLESMAHHGTTTTEGRDGGVCTGLFESGTIVGPGFLTTVNLNTLYGAGTCP